MLTARHAGTPPRIPSLAELLGSPINPENWKPPAPACRFGLLPILNAIGCGNATRDAVAAELGLSKATSKAALTELFDKGMIGRNTEPAPRRGWHYRYHLTSAGMAELDEWDLD